MNRPEIKAILFDWGGVLIEDPAPDFLNEFSLLLDVPKVDLQLVFTEYHLRFQTGLVKEVDIWKDLCNRLGVEVPPSQSGSLWKDVVRKVFKNKTENWDLVKSLRHQGFKTGLLSNTEVPTREFFFEQGYDQYFDALVFSCDEGRVKPDPLIYQLALDRLDLPAVETVFIDDRRDFAQSATALGIHGITFENIPQMKTKLRALGVSLD
jgi:epoxide hydrolase-like predicted phosphatase